MLLIPHYGAGNPYSHLLGSSLEQEGVDVRVGKVRGWLPLFRAVRDRGKPDIIHLQWQHRFFLKEDEAPLSAGFRTLLFFVQWLVLRSVGIRFVWTVHNLLNHERELVRLEMPACRLLARLVDGIIVHCDAAAERVSEAYRVSRDKLRTVPHGHYMGWYPDPVDRDHARRELALPGKATIFLHFGHIRPYKGVEGLVQDFSALELDDAFLVILGAPRYEALGETLRELARSSSRIRLELRFASDEELSAYLGAADAVVLPFADTLTSGSAILAASAGRALIAPALGCLREFPESAMIRYSAEDPKGLPGALTEAMSAPLHDMGRSALQYVRRFSWERTGSGLMSLYGDILESAET